jgi:hypothetical protein
MRGRPDLIYTSLGASTQAGTDTSTKLLYYKVFDLVRAVGIEPTLLSEPDFEWDEPQLNICIYYHILSALATCVRFCESLIVEKRGYQDNSKLRD